jgi:hypothetical protein
VALHRRAQHLAQIGTREGEQIAGDLGQRHRHT